ncbi:MAG: YihY/virulence factor BrkB family protein [Burkholderiaceae bacterium]
MEGWLDVFARLFREVIEDRVLLVSAGVTYYALLAATPALSSAVSFYGLLADPATIANQLAYLDPFVPAAVLDVVREQLTTVAMVGNDRLGIAVVLSLGATLWAANAGMKGLFEAMNVAYEEAEKRSFAWLTVVTMFMTLSFIFLFSLATLLVVAVPTIVERLSTNGGHARVVALVSTGVLLFAVYAAVLLLYRWGASRRHAQWRWLFPGATVALILGTVGSWLFAWYLNNFGFYDKTYGSLGAIIAFMTWIWLLSILLILGAELNAEIEHQTSRDTTIGPFRPMGLRGATMADDIGRPRHALGDAGLDKPAFASPIRFARRRRAFSARPGRPEKRDLTRIYLAVSALALAGATVARGRAIRRNRARIH